MYASFPMVSPVWRPGELLRSKITGEADGRDVCMIVVLSASSLSETIDCDGFSVSGGGGGVGVPWVRFHLLFSRLNFFFFFFL